MTLFKSSNNNFNKDPTQSDEETDFLMINRSVRGMKILPMLPDSETS